VQVLEQVQVRVQVQVWVRGEWRLSGTMDELGAG
jgi:hypothetical protein